MLVFLLTYLTECSVAFVQAVHEVFVAEEWIKDAWNEARVEANLRVEANRALGAA